MLNEELQIVDEVSELTSFIIQAINGEDGDFMLRITDVEYKNYLKENDFTKEEIEKYSFFVKIDFRFFIIKHNSIEDSYGSGSLEIINVNKELENNGLVINKIERAYVKFFLSLVNDKPYLPHYHLLIQIIKVFNEIKDFYRNLDKIDINSEEFIKARKLLFNNSFLPQNKLLFPLKII